MSTGIVVASLPFLHISELLSHSLCSGSLAPADWQLCEDLEESSTSFSCVPGLDCSQCLVMEYCAFISLAEETFGRLDYCLHFPVSLTIVG